MSFDKYILPLILTIANWLIGRSALKAQRQNDWIDLLEHISNDLNISLKLRRSDQAQHDDLQSQWEAKYGKQDDELLARHRQNPGMNFKRDEDGNIVSNGRVAKKTT